MTTRELSVSHLELETRELESVMLQMGFAQETELWQAEYYPTNFLPFVVVILHSAGSVDLIFASLTANATRIDLAFEEFSGNRSREEIESLFDKHREDLASPNLWQERKSISSASFEEFRRKLDSIGSANLGDVNVPCLDGLFVRGKILKLGHTAHSFSVSCLYREQCPEHYAYFWEFHRVASEHLDQERSLKCLEQIKKNF